MSLLLVKVLLPRFRFQWREFLWRDHCSSAVKVNVFETSRVFRTKSSFSCWTPFSPTNNNSMGTSENRAPFFFLQTREPLCKITWYPRSICYLWLKWEKSVFACFLCKKLLGEREPVMLDSRRGCSSAFGHEDMPFYLNSTVTAHWTLDNLNEYFLESLLVNWEEITNPRVSSKPITSSWE